MSPYILPSLGVFVLLTFAAGFIVRVRESIRIGEQTKPLSRDDRLRISLAATSLLAAEKELSKAAWIDNEPGHPHVTALVWDLKQVQYRAHKLLRES